MAQDLPLDGKCWLVTLIVALTACTPRGETVALTGTITVTYAGTPSDFSAAFDLANGTRRSIYFRGIPDPREWHISCSSSEGATGFSQALLDPPPTEEVIEVASGRGLRFDVHFLGGDLKNTQGSCQLKLTLIDGTVVESPEFTPAQASRLPRDRCLIR